MKWSNATLLTSAKWGVLLDMAAKLTIVRKRHLIAVAAHNLGIVMRHLFGFSKLEPLLQPPGFFVFAFVFAVFTSFKTQPDS